MANLLGTDMYTYCGQLPEQSMFFYQVRKEIYNAYKRWKTGDKTYGRKQPIQHFVSI